MEENQVVRSEPNKWEAKFTATINKASSDKIWSFFEDFFGFDKWFPGLTACYGIHGNNNEPGSIRYCASEHQSDGGEKVVDHWAKERLNAIDKNEKLITYEFLENSVGFTNFVASFKVKDGDEGGCVIEWSISLDPVEGLKFEEIVKMNEGRVKQIAEKMEQAALNG